MWLSHTPSTISESDSRTDILIALLYGLVDQYAYLRSMRVSRVHTLSISQHAIGTNPGGPEHHSPKRATLCCLTHGHMKVGNLDSRIFRANYPFTGVMAC